MALLGVKPVSRRVVVGSLSVFALVAVVSVTGIVAKQAAPAQAAAPRMPFAADAKVGLIYFTVKETGAADFEAILPKVKEALAKSDQPVRKQQAASWKFYKLPAANGQIVYICLVDPVVSGADYDPIKILSEGFPTEVGAMYKKIEGAILSINMTGIDKVADMASGGLTNHQ
jgi:hypothetical protein